MKKVLIAGLLLIASNVCTASTEQDHVNITNQLSNITTKLDDLHTKLNDLYDGLNPFITLLNKNNTKKLDLSIVPPAPITMTIPTDLPATPILSGDLHTSSAEHESSNNAVAPHEFDMTPPVILDQPNETLLPDTNPVVTTENLPMSPPELTQYQPIDQTQGQIDTSGLIGATEVVQPQTNQIVDQNGVIVIPEAPIEQVQPIDQTQQAIPVQTPEVAQVI